MRNAAEKKQVWNGINDHLLFSFSCSNTFSFFPVHLGNYLKLMGLSPAGLRELFFFSFLWTRYSCSALKSAPTWLQSIFYLAFLISHYFSLKWSKRQLPNPYLCSPCNTADRLVSEYHLPASWGFLISISPWLNNAKCAASMAYWLNYVQDLPFPLTSPVLSLHLPSWPPPASMTGILECLCA